MEFLTTEEGPYFPHQLVIPERSDLTQIASGVASAKGELIHVGGLIVGSDCEQLDDAWITIWQADRNGLYKHDSLDNGDQLDRNFGYFGKVRSDKGKYLFKTIRPAPYSFEGLNRARHIHFEMTHPKLGRATTEMYFGGSEESERRKGDKVWLERNSRSRTSLVRSPLNPSERSAGEVEFPDDDHPAYRFDLHFAQVQS